MAACTKVAAFGAMLRVAYVGVERRRAGTGRRWSSSVAVLTMVVGAVLSVTQTDVKRLLAYSSIAHAGFILVGVLAMDESRLSRRAVLPASPTASPRSPRSPSSRWSATNGSEATHLSQWAGLGKAPPRRRGRLRVLLLAFAGIPLTSASRPSSPSSRPPSRTAAGPVGLVVVGVLASAIAAFFYVRVIVLMYFTEPTGDDVDVARARRR